MPVFRPPIIHPGLLTPALPAGPSLGGVGSGETAEPIIAGDYFQQGLKDPLARLVGSGGPAGGGGAPSPLSRAAVEDPSALALVIVKKLPFVSPTEREEILEKLADLFFQVPLGDRYPLTLQLEQALASVTGVGSSVTRRELTALLTAEFLNKIFPSLPPQDRLPAALRISEGLLVSDWRVGRVQKALEEITPQVPQEGDQLPLAEGIVDLMCRPPPQGVGWRAMDPLKAVFRRLDEVERGIAIEKIKEYLKAEDASVRRIAVDSLRILFPDIPSGLQLPVVEAVEGTISDPEYLVRRSTVEFLWNVVPGLKHGDRLPRGLKIIDRLLNHQEKEWEYFAGCLRQTFPHLSSAELESVADLAESGLSAKHSENRRNARRILQDVIPLLPEPLRPPRIEVIAKGIEAEEAGDRANVLYTLAALSPSSILPERRYSLALEVEAKWGRGDVGIDNGGLDYWRRSLPYLSEDQAHDLVSRVQNRWATLPFSSRGQALILFREAFPILSQECRFGILLTVLKQPTASENPYGFNQNHEDKFLREMLPSLSPSWRVRLLDEWMTGQDPSHLRLKHFPTLLHRVPTRLILEKGEDRLTRLEDYRASGLPFIEPLWQKYWQSSDPQRFLRETSEKVREFRHGRPLQGGDPDEILLAYCGLDQPAALSLERFSEMVAGKRPPPSPFLNRAFEADVLIRKSHHHRIDKGRLYEALKILETDPVLRQILDKPGNEARRERVLRLKDDKIPSEVLLEVLIALQELYQDEVEDSPLVLKQRRLLAAEREKIKDQRGHKVRVAFVPSKSQADRAFGYVVDDCNKQMGQVVDREDFQIYRMVAEDRLVGMLYLQRYPYFFLRKALVLAIQPRSTWEVDQEILLRVVEENLSRIAKDEGYRYVFMMKDKNQRSNPSDMLRAIEHAAYPDLELDKGVDGAVFKGSEFLVIWKKGQKIRPAPDFSNQLLPIVEEELEEALEPVRQVHPIPARPAVAVNPVSREVPMPRPIKIDLEDRFDPQAMAELQRLASSLIDRSIRSRAQRNRIMRARDPGFLAEVSQAFAEAHVSLPMGLGGPGEPGTALARATPDALTRYASLMKRPGEIVAPGTMILKFRSLEAILMDPRITQTDRGWFEPSFRGKDRVVESGEVVGGAPPASEQALARGNELTPQDLFDFYNVVFYQGAHLRGYLRLLQNRGADIQSLQPIIQDLSQNLDNAIHELLAHRYDEALVLLRRADLDVTRFQRTMRKIAHSVKLEIDPVLGLIYPR